MYVQVVVAVEAVAQVVAMGGSRAERRSISRLLTGQLGCASFGLFALESVRAADKSAKTDPKLRTMDARVKEFHCVIVNL